MSVERFFSTSESQQRLRAGPLRRAIDGFAAWLAIEGYAYRSAAAKLRFVGNLSRWLEREELGVEALDDQRVEAFLLARGPTSGRGGKATTGLRPGTQRPAGPHQGPEGQVLGRWSIEVPGGPAYEACPAHQENQERRQHREQAVIALALAGSLDGPEAALAWERRAYIGFDAEASEGCSWTRRAGTGSRTSCCCPPRPMRTRPTGSRGGGSPR